MNTSINIYTYAVMRGDIPFKVSPLNETDAMILSQLSGIDFTGIVPKSTHASCLLLRSYRKRPSFSTVARLYYRKNLAQKNEDQFTDAEKLLLVVGSSKRFGSLKIDAYIKDNDEEIDKQFSAITYYLSPFKSFIAFRGTDGTYESWKENFNMTYMLPIPAQEDALLYVKTLTRRPFQRVIIAGHSKGGNLAYYSALFSGKKIQSKIKSVFMFDAPGLLEDFSNEENYKNIETKIHSYLPKSSVIGTLLIKPFDETIVDSDASGISQHNMMTWQLDGIHLLTVDKRDDYSYNTEKAVSDWMNKIPVSSRKEHVDAFFDILKKNHVRHINDLPHLDVKQMWGLFKGATSLSGENKEFLGILFKKLR